MPTNIPFLASLTLICRGVICMAAAPPFTGAAVFLNNTDVNHPIYYQTIGNPAAGADFYVEILEGSDANSLQPVQSQLWPNLAVFNIGTGDSQPGYFDGNFGIVPGIDANAVAVFQVLAWKGAPSFDLASEAVASAIFAQPTGISNPPSPPAPTLLQFPANLVIPDVPEPAVWVLCLVGLAGLFGAGRRRQTNRNSDGYLHAHCQIIVITLTAGSAICLGAENAGPSVFLSNIDANHPIYYQTVGSLAAGPGFYVEIFGGPDADHLLPVGIRVTGLTTFSIGTGVNQPGFFDGGIGIIPEYSIAQPVMATFQVFAWKDAPSYDAASQRVASLTWSQMTAYSEAPPGGIPHGVPLEFPANLVIRAVPEPSTLAMALVGLLGVLVCRASR